jgi:hypothetical protein
VPICLAVVLFGVVILSGCGQPQAPPKEVTVNLDGETLRISSPSGQDNLTVFLIHADSQDERDFFTLDEGLEQGLVTITEKDNARVSELDIDNRSDRPPSFRRASGCRGASKIASSSPAW